MNTNFVNDCFDVSKQLEKESSLLNELAYCFKMVGNDEMYAKLGNLAGRLNLQSEKIRKICGDKVDNDLQSAQQSSSNILAAALAGAAKEKNV